MTVQNTLSKRDLPIIGSESIKFAAHLKVVDYQEKYYIIAYDDDSAKVPVYLTFMDKNNTIQIRCKFKSKYTLHLLPKETSYAPKHCNPLVEKFQQGQFVDFNISSKFTFDESMQLTKHNTFIGDIGYFDFDNDGKKEYVQLFEDINTSNIFYKEIEENLQTLKTNSVVDQSINMWAIEGNNTYYLEGYFNNTDNPPAIGIIDKKSSKSVCRYDYTIKTVLDDEVK